MDMCNNDPPPRAAALLQKFSTEEKPRPVLVTSEKNNAAPANGKSRRKEITSRYKMGITSAPRPSSPSARQTSQMPRTLVLQRPQSAEGKRPSTPSSWRSAPSSPQAHPSSPSTPSPRSSVSSSPSSRPSTPPSSPLPRSRTPVRDSTVERVTSSRRSLFGRAQDGLWPSTRSLSASFQSDTPALSNRTDKAVRNPSPDRSLKPFPDAVSERKRTPLRGRNASDESENSKPVVNSHTRVIEQLRWPAMMGGKASSKALPSKSLDLTDRVNKSADLPISTRGSSPMRRVPLIDGLSKSLQKSSCEAACLLSADGNEKVTHGTTSAFQKSSCEAACLLSADGSENVTHETTSARSINSLPSEGSPSVTTQSRTPSPIITRIRPSSLPSEGAPSGTTQSRTPSPIITRIRPSSPNKSFPASLSNSRGMLSPTQSRPSSPFSLLSSQSRPSSPSSSPSNVTTRMGVSVFNYIADFLKGRKNANHLEDAHQLRLLYNRELQWRFVNARTDAAFSTERLTAEDMLYNVWNTTSELRDSVFLKRIDVQNQRLEEQLNTILKAEIAYLEEWSDLEKEHSTSLLGAIEALKATTLRLPATGGARADVRAVKNAISSAVDVMQAMGSSVCSLLPKVEGTNSLVSELSEVASMERTMLNECRELLASTTAMQVQECSLRTNVIQLGQDVQVE